MDGADLAACVPRPCILAADEGYNQEWSTELTVAQAQDEYIKAWCALKVISKVYGLGDPDGFVFNMSVGYDLEGIKGEELNPIEFLTMLYGNIKALQETDGNGPAGFYDAETGVKNDYEKDQREIEELMLRFLPLYMEDLQRGAYTVPAHTEQSLRHIFTMGAMKEYFYEQMPSIANPLGLGRKAMPLACKVQNLLIADFLN